ncbi:MAG: tol-pal system protein YbgF [Nitrospinae bacterium]|nr:tol-pal system protein YbgF [Nitrospinota bacterium]
MKKENISKAYRKSFFSHYILVVIFLLTGCATSKEREDLLMKSIKEINKDIVQINSELGKSNSEIGKLNSEIGKLNIEVGNISSQLQQKTGVVEETRTGQMDIKKILSDTGKVLETSKKNQADLKMEMTTLSDGLQQISSKTDEYVYRISNLTQRLDSIDARLNQLSEIYKTTIAERGKKEDMAVKDTNQKLNSLGSGLVSVQSELSSIKIEIKSVNEKAAEIIERDKEALRKKGIKTTSVFKKKPAAEGAAAVEAPKKEESKTIPEPPASPQSQTAELPLPVGESIPAESQPIVAMKPEDVYKTAYSDYLKGSFQLAVSGFRSYIEKFPDTELAGNSQYWIAECYYSTGDYEMAISEFNEVINRYPRNTKVTSSMLKIAYSKIKLNQMPDAAAQLRELIKKYPNSDEARLAKERLKAIK